MLTYGVLCSLAEKHGVTITENVRAFVREVEEQDRRAPTSWKKEVPLPEEWSKALKAAAEWIDTTSNLRHFPYADAWATVLRRLAAKRYFVDSDDSADESVSRKLTTADELIANLRAQNQAEPVPNAFAELARKSWPFITDENLRDVWDGFCERAIKLGQWMALVEGWQLVPKIPTDEMMGATRPGDWPSEVWVKMLAAAPTQQQEGGK